MKIKKLILELVVFCLIAVVVVPILVGLFIVGKTYVLEYFTRIEFSQVVWANTAVVYKQPYPRIKMINDLLLKFPLKGKTRAEVISLLGKPEAKSYFKNYDLVYWLGPERGFISIDSEWLLIKINKQDVVDEYSIATD